jgi:hypothetical protein
MKTPFLPLEADKVILALLTENYYKTKLMLGQKIWEMSDITIDGDVKHNKEFVSIFFS